MVNGVVGFKFRGLVMGVVRGVIMGLVSRVVGVVIRSWFGCGLESQLWNGKGWDKRVMSKQIY